MTPLLDSISDPSDIKNFTSDQLNVLAEDIRHKIIDVVSVNGGHLASNLGIVELTIALHRVFNSPNDKFIFDVSHQTYPHKLLTGRQEKFSKIRQHKGLCGFSHPKESEHDHFLAGHAGTALSLALGVAKARDLLKSDEFVIPILGDASLTCGLTLEALNNIPKDLKNFIVILNDNKMSISKNTGAISNILSRIVNSPTSNKIYDDLEQMLAKIPSLGTFLAKQGTKVKESIKNLISAAPFFEQFGLSYVGPFDGHNTEQLIETLSALKDHNKPIILHVLTTKGKGMQTAINDPTCYHGCKPFDKQTGKFLPAKSVNPTFPQIFGKTLLEMASNDPSVVAITPAMPSGSCLEELMDIYPERCIDVGIAEGHSVTYGAGIAYNRKLKVVCSVYSTFLQRAFDNLFHDVCLQEIPIVFAIDRAGISGPDGSTHHGIYDISFLNAMPNMVICQPRNGQVLVDLLKSAFSWQRPVAIRYPNLMTQEESQPYRQRELGVSEVLQEGSKVAIIALGHMCTTALEVAKRFTEQQITPTVIDPIFIKPIDADMLYKILSTHQYIVTIEEHALTVGLGSIVNNFIVRNGFNNVLVANFGIPEVFVDHGSNAELLKEHGLSADKILEKCVDIFNMQHKLENMDTYL